MKRLSDVSLVLITKLTRNENVSTESLIRDLIKLLAEWFHVTSEAMLYRVQELKEKGLLG